MVPMEDVLFSHTFGYIISSGNSFNRQIVNFENLVPSISTPSGAVIPIMHPFSAPTTIVEFCAPQVLFGGITFLMFPAFGQKSNPGPENVNFNIPLLLFPNPSVNDMR